MAKSIADMSDAEIAEMLTNYEEAGSAGVLDVENLVEMPTDLLVELIVALDFVDEMSEGSAGEVYPWLMTNIEGEYQRRAGQMPLK